VETQEILQIQKYRDFSRKYLESEQIKSLAEFSWRVQDLIPPRQILEKYPQMPRQAVDVLWWSESQDELGGYVWRRYDELMALNAPQILYSLKLIIPNYEHQKDDLFWKGLVKETMFSTIVKSLAIASLDIELPQERTTEQINGINILSIL
jgi:hypothetical protein